MGKTMKRPKSNAREVWGILNLRGDVWTTDTFETPEEARFHIVQYWHNFPGDHGTDTTKYKVVRVRVRVSAIFPLKDQANVG